MSETRSWIVLILAASLILLSQGGQVTQLTISFLSVFLPMMLFFCILISIDKSLKSIKRSLEDRKDEGK